MARRPEGPAAAFDALRLLRSLELRHARSHPRRALREVSRSRRSRSEPRPPRSSTARASRARKRGACIDPAGYDAGKKIMGKKRHILVDTQGLLMHAIVHAADIQDRDGRGADGDLVRRLSVPDQLFADGGYRGSRFQAAIGQILARVKVEIVKRSDQAKAFVVLPKRWIVERTLAWLGRCRRLAIRNASTARRSRSSASPPSASCCENYAIPHNVSGQLLRKTGGAAPLLQLA